MFLSVRTCVCVGGGNVGNAFTQTVVRDTNRTSSDGTWMLKLLPVDDSSCGKWRRCYSDDDFIKPAAKLTEHWKHWCSAADTQSAISDIIKWHVSISLVAWYSTAYFFYFSKKRFIYLLLLNAISFPSFIVIGWDRTCDRRLAPPLNHLSFCSIVSTGTLRAHGPMSRVLEDVNVRSAVTRRNSQTGKTGKY